MAAVGVGMLVVALVGMLALSLEGTVRRMLLRRRRDSDGADRESAERVIDGARVSEPVVLPDPPVWEAVTGEAWGDATTAEIERIKDGEEAQVSEQGERLAVLRPAVPGHGQPGPVRGVRVDCHECAGQGFVVKSVNDLLRESLALLGDAGDAVVTEFYRRLVAADNGKDPADQLASLFPPDLLTASAFNAEDKYASRGAAQRDRLLKALVALADLYHPDDPAALERLDNALAAYGRAHAPFVRPDGPVRGASLAEYAAVQQVLMGALHDAAGKAWLPGYDAAWAEAFDYAAAKMMVEQHRVTISGEFTMGRMPREARDASSV